MMRYCLSLLLIITTALNAQAQKMAEDQYAEATHSRQSGNDSTAIDRYLFLVQHYPHSKFCIPAYFELGSLYEKRNENKRAIAAYREAAFRSYDRVLRYDTLLPSFDDKVVAVEHLVNLYEKMGNYDSALHFLYFHDTVLNIFYSCVVEPDYTTQANLCRYADLHLKAKRVREAEKILLSKHLFKWRDYEGEFDGHCNA